VALLFAVGADADRFGTGGFDGPSALWAAYESAPLQYFLADRDLSAVGAWATASVLAVPTSFRLAAGLRRLPGLRRVL